MKGVKVLDVQEHNSSLTILAQKDLDFGICPDCGIVSQKLKDKHIHPITDKPVFENGAKMSIVKRRWKCVNELCDVNTFTEEIDGLVKKCTHTELFYSDVYKLSRRMTYTEAYKYLREFQCMVSLSTVYKKAQQRLHQEVAVPEVLEARFIGLDEFSKGKDHDYGVVLVDLERNKVFDVTDGGKTKKAASTLLEKVNPDKVKACCIDMWKPFRSACYETLPGILVVVDHFHVIKEVCHALDKVRKRMRKHFKSKEKKSALYEYRELLWIGSEKLTPKQEERLWEILSWSEVLTRAYEFKELLRAVYAGEDFWKAGTEINNWIREAKAAGIPEMNEVAETLVAWKTEILNFWIYRISNAATEGKINKIKALRRKAYNYNNFQSLRLKILEQE